MGRSCLSTDRRVRWARMLSSNLHSNTLHTRQKYTNCALQCILYTVNRAERRQSIENARSGEEQSGERLYSSSSSGMRWRLATKILSGPGTNPIEVQDFCADLLNISRTSFSPHPPNETPFMFFITYLFKLIFIVLFLVASAYLAQP